METQIEWSLSHVTFWTLFPIKRYICLGNADGLRREKDLTCLEHSKSILNLEYCFMTCEDNIIKI